jgi:integrase/recombinase XerD
VIAYAYDLRAFVQFLDDHGLAWTDVEVDDLTRFVRWLEQPAGNVVLVHGAQPARSPATIARAVNAVHAFFDYYVTRGVPVARRLVSFSRTPKPHWRNPHRTGRATQRAVTIPVPKQAPETLTAEEVQRLLDACHHQRDRFFLALLYETGMRVGQALGLRHEDFVSRLDRDGDFRFNQEDVGTFLDVLEALFIEFLEFLWFGNVVESNGVLHPDISCRR